MSTVQPWDMRLLAAGLVSDVPLLPLPHLSTPGYTRCPPLPTYSSVNAAARCRCCHCRTLLPQGGIFAGSLHAVTGPDHLAVSPGGFFPRPRACKSPTWFSRKPHDRSSSVAVSVHMYHSHWAMLASCMHESHPYAHPRPRLLCVHKLPCARPRPRQSPRRCMFCGWVWPLPPRPYAQALLPLSVGRRWWSAINTGAYWGALMMFVVGTSANSTNR